MPLAATHRPSVPVWVVLTGGPGAGKSTSLELLARHTAWEAWRASLGGVVAVREAATGVYAERDLRWDRLDDEARREVQRAIYARQRAAERDAAARAADAGVVLLDRGTVDGSAYWPDGPDAYWPAVGSSPDAEFARYDAVVVLETAAALGGGIYDGDASNAVRFESADAAVAGGVSLARLWERHPHVTHVPAAATFEAKLQAVADAVARAASQAQVARRRRG